MTQELDPERPAILGGAPVRPQGPPPWPRDDPAVREALARLASTGDWGKYEGPHAESLVARIRARTGLEHVVLCSSGTAAVELALRGLGVGAGDEVVLAGYDFKANFTNVSLLGATPVLVDVRASDRQLDVDRVANAISPKTRAVVASHLHGGWVDMASLAETCEGWNVPILEDACQCPGAVVQGRAAGAWGAAGVFSFGGSKLTTAGRGGAVVTADASVRQRIRLYVERGNAAYPLSEAQCAILAPQWERLDEDEAKRAKTAELLSRSLRRERLGATPFEPAFPSQDARPGWFKFGAVIDRELLAGMSREVFCEAMRAEGVDFGPGFRALHRIHSQRKWRAEGALTLSEACDEDVVVLHHPVLLEGAAAVDEILRAAGKIRDEAEAITASAPPAL